MKKLFRRMICKYFGHVNTIEYERNGYKKGTYGTHKPVKLFQKRCIRCGHYFGEKI